MLMTLSYMSEPEIAAATRDATAWMLPMGTTITMTVGFAKANTKSTSKEQVKERTNKHNSG